MLLSFNECTMPSCAKSLNMLSLPWSPTLAREDNLCTPKNGDIDDTTMGGIIGTPSGYIFVCGIESDPSTLEWAT